MCPAEPKSLSLQPGPNISLPLFIGSVRYIYLYKATFANYCFLAFVVVFRLRKTFLLSTLSLEQNVSLFHKYLICVVITFKDLIARTPKQCRCLPLDRLVSLYVNNQFVVERRDKKPALLVVKQNLSRPQFVLNICWECAVCGPFYGVTQWTLGNFSVNLIAI